MRSTGPSLRIRVTKGFLRSYDSASLLVQRCAERAIHDFVRKYRSDATRCLRTYDRIAGRTELLEIDIGGGERLIATLRSGGLSLLDVGDHSVTAKWSRSRTHAAPDFGAAPDQFLPEDRTGFFSRAPDIRVSHFANEIQPDWIYFLDEQQRAAFERIRDALYEFVGSEKSRAYWIVGGPGTGKTSILLNLLKWAVDAKLRVEIHLTDSLAEYVERSVAVDLSKMRAQDVTSLAMQLGEGDSDRTTNRDLVLVDDPSTTMAIALATVHAASGKTHVSVAAFDPLQLRDSLTDGEFEVLVRRHDVTVVQLNRCYRQKANVGKASKRAADAIAASTPFLAQDKIARYRKERAVLTQQANDLLFPNRIGYTEVHIPAEAAHLAKEIRRISVTGQLWRHWPPLLVVTDESLKVPEEWRRIWREVDCREVSFVSLGEIKGLEFQHCFIFLTEELYSALETGFKGSGQAVYNQRRLLRIPFLRAKDSIVTFVVKMAE